jgi:hypothetical protein
MDWETNPAFSPTSHFPIQRTRHALLITTFTKNQLIHHGKRR